MEEQQLCPRGCEDASIVPTPPRPGADQASVEIAYANRKPTVSRIADALHVVDKHQTCQHRARAHMSPPPTTFVDPSSSCSPPPQALVNTGSNTPLAARGSCFHQRTKSRCNRREHRGCARRGASVLTTISPWGQHPPASSSQFTSLEPETDTPSTLLTAKQTLGTNKWRPSKKELGSTQRRFMTSWRAWPAMQIRTYARIGIQDVLSLRGTYKRILGRNLSNT